MVYNKTTWLTGDLITSAKMNNLEDGLEAIFTKVDKITSDADDRVDFNTPIHALAGIVLKDAVTDVLYELKISNGTVLFNPVK